ncbi:SAM-dependent methyltransferase [Candidatus Vidania fulgoroideorum]
MFDCKKKYSNKKFRKNIQLRSKAYFKIKKINERFSILKNYCSVLDIGCSPGGWGEYFKNKKIKYTGIDLKKTPFIFGLNFIKGDLFKYSSIKKIFDFLGKPELVLSDLCPNLSFYNKINHKNILKKMIEIIFILLKKGGSFVFKSMSYIKISNFFLNYFENFFYFITKKNSSEIYYICKKFK